MRQRHRFWSTSMGFKVVLHYSTLILQQFSEVAQHHLEANAGAPEAPARVCVALALLGRLHGLKGVATFLLLYFRKQGSFTNDDNHISFNQHSIVKEQLRPCGTLVPYPAAALSDQSSRLAITSYAMNVQSISCGLKLNVPASVWPEFSSPCSSVSSTGLVTERTQCLLT
jgi:hypothetical protein